MMSGGIAPCDFIHLPNSFVDLMLVIGLDDNTKLITTDKAKSVEDILDNLFTQEYEPQVLAAVSANTMMHFFPFPREDLEYPLVQSKEKLFDLKQQYQTFDNIPRGHFSKALHQSRMSRTITPKLISRQMSIRVKPKMKKSMQAPNTSAEFPVSEELIRSITTFCFPDDMRIKSDKSETFTHFLVLTDIKGDKTYATCITFYRPYIVEKDDDNNMYMTLNTGSTYIKGGINCYIPHCCVLISKFPYFSVMKDCLSLMIHKVQEQPEEMYTFVKEFAYRLTMTPAPPAGKVAIEVTLHHTPFTIYPPQNANKPVIDIPMYLVFLLFHPEEILKILSAILVEHRLVFMSRNYGLLTTVMESFTNFILPFQWKFTYVPVLSTKSLELLEAPGTFMMGCHSVHKGEAEEIGGLVVVDIDEGSVSINPDIAEETRSNLSSDSEGISEITDIPEIPTEAASMFIAMCKRAKFQFDLVDIGRPSHFDIAAERAFRTKKIQSLNEIITAGCLELMVNLFRGVVGEIRVDFKRFNKAAFLETKSTSERKFYEQVMKTGMFKIFLKDRMSDKTDYWVELELKTRQHIQKRENVQVALKRRPLRKQSSVSMFPAMSPSREMKIFMMPHIMESGFLYLKKTIDEMTKSLQRSQDFQERASYTYLLGMLHFTSCKPVLALEMFMSLAAIDTTILPTALLQQICQQIGEKEMRKLSSKPGFHVLPSILGSVPKESVHSSHKKFEESLKIPEKDLFYEQFADAISLLEVTSDYDTIGRLFQALLPSQIHQNYVDQETFSAFCQCWQDNNEMCRSLIIDEESLPEDECVLKVSSLCKTDFGTGRIIITDRRLCLLKDISSDVKEIIRLRDISGLEKKVMYSFLKQVKVLRIKGQDGSKFTAWLKEERDQFCLLIDEMWAGKIVSDSTKDIHAVQKAAENVLIVDAYLTSAQDQYTAHHGVNEDVAKRLCFYKRYRDEGHHNLPQDTKETLQNKIDPNFGEKERKTVHALLYTPGVPDHSVSPRLWVGLGDGKIKVYNATHWILESEFVQTKQSVRTRQVSNVYYGKKIKTCLVAVGNGHVWAGSFGIFIIDIETIRSNKALMDHQDIVMDIVSVENGRYAYTASINGTIMKWDVQKLTKIDPVIKLKDVNNLRSIKFHDGFLWCATWHNIFKVNDSGSVVQTFTFQPDVPTVKPIEMDCFLILQNKEIWGGCRREGKLIIWDIETGNIKETVNLDCRGVSDMIVQKDRVWAGSKDGRIYVIKCSTKQPVKLLQAHDDAVRALCNADERYILSGAGSNDGKIAIWTCNDSRTESGTYLL